MNTIYLISKTFIDNNEILKELERITKDLGLDIYDHNYSEYVALQFNKTEYDKDWQEEVPKMKFELMMDGEIRFNQTKKDNNFIEGHGIIGYIYFEYEKNNILLEFLKKLLNQFPDMLVYNELGNAIHQKPFVFSKKHIENSKDLYTLNKPPQNF